MHINAFFGSHFDIRPHSAFTIMQIIIVAAGLTLTFSLELV